MYLVQGIHFVNTYALLKLKIMLKNTWKIINYEVGLKIQNLHDLTRNSLFDDLFQKITIYQMQGMNFVTT